MKNILAFLLILTAANCEQGVTSPDPAAAARLTTTALTPIPQSSPAAIPTRLEEPAFICDKQYKTQMVRTGDFHGEDVKAKSGAGWMGLYRVRKGYYLLPTSIKIKAVRDEMVDGPSERTGKRVTGDHPLPELFLVKNNLDLSKGEVKTLFDGFKRDPEYLNAIYRREFSYGSRKYLLKVNEPSSPNEYLTENSSLTLSSGKSSQTIYTQTRCSDCGWALEWAGDLDRDGRLDLMLDLSDHYNVVKHHLFLSSRAGKNELVRLVAVFCTVGC